MNTITQERQVRFGWLGTVGEKPSALPLQRTRVNAQVLGPLVSVSVTQQFTNPQDKALELEYLFPLPQEAAVLGFELRFGGRVVTGTLKELEQARQDYEAGRDAGKVSAMLETRRANLFAVKLANVMPGVVIESSLQYQQRVKFDDGQYEFVFPMGLTPKYDSPSVPGEGEGTHAPIASPDQVIGPVEISVAVDAGLAVADPASPSHALALTRLDDRRFQVQLKGQHIPDHDFVLRYAALNPQTSAAAWLSGDTFLATLVPPALPDDFTPPARDFIFVLDRSGSMSGEAIAQARNALRACLRVLNEQDTFGVLLFDDRLEWFNRAVDGETPRRPAGHPASYAVAQASIDEADRFLAGVEARGGTEIVAALQAALELPAPGGRTRYVVFLTDGAVSAEERALQEVRKKIGAARLFTFGIGPSVNRALLSKLASLGRGTAEFLQLHEDIEGAIIRFQDRVSFPMLTDLTLDWQNAAAWDLYPARLTDLYAGQPLELCGRVKISGAEAALLVHGQVQGQKVTMRVALSGGENAEPMIGRAWARARLDDLMERMAEDPQKASALRAEIIGLALEHHLVTPYTAFVALDQDVANPGAAPALVQVAQPLPQGLEMEGFMGGGPVFAAAPAVAPGGGLLRSMMAPPSPMASPQPLQSKKGAPSSGVTLPAFMRRAKRDSAPAAAIYSQAADADEKTLEMEMDKNAAPQTETLEETLRWLARTQNMNGSWEDDADLTACALLLFVRSGHTTRSGSFRQLVRRAAGWLQKAAGWLAEKALAELAAAAGGTAQPVSGAPAGAVQNAVAAFLSGQPAGLDPAREGGSLGRVLRALLK